MGEVLGWGKSNKFFGGDGIVWNYYFGGMTRESVMEHESGNVGDAQCEIFPLKPEEFRLNSMLWEINKEMN